MTGAPVVQKGPIVPVPFPNGVQCDAQSKRSGKRCRAPAVRGAAKCHKHLGRRVEDVRQEIAVRKQAALALQRNGFAPVADPLTALQELAGEALAFKDAVGSLVGDLKEWRYNDGKSGEQIRAEIVIYERAMDRAGRLLADIARLGIDERLARVQEAQTSRVVAAVEALLDHLGLDDTARAQARVLLAQELRR